MLILNTVLSLLVGSAEVERWTPQSISSDQYESSPVFSPDGKEMYFFRADPSFSRYSLAWAKCETGGWIEQEPLPFMLPAPVDESDPFMSEDGRRLYFISTRTPEGGVKADFDIWYADRDADGRWGPAERLPEPVNSPGSELLPRHAPDGGIMFGSDRAGGLGGQDIYTAHRSAGGKWTVRNLGAPINSAASEYEAAASVDGKQLVVVSDTSGRSHLHLYRYEQDGWVANGVIAARDDVFQVGPLFSPLGHKLVFAQADSVHSGEFFVATLDPTREEHWPPRCP